MNEVLAYYGISFFMTCVIGAVLIHHVIDSFRVGFYGYFALFVTFLIGVTAIAVYMVYLILGII